jgi:hypothetical protein
LVKPIAPALTNVLAGTNVAPLKMLKLLGVFKVAGSTLTVVL